MKDGVAVFVVTRRGQVDQPLLQLQRFASHHFRNHLRAELFEQLGIAAYVAAIQQGNIEFEIVAVQLAALRQGTGGGADAKMQVPERLGNWRNHPLLRIFTQGGFMQEKHIYVGTAEIALAGRIRRARRCRSGRLSQEKTGSTTR